MRQQLTSLLGLALVGGASMLAAQSNPRTLVGQVFEKPRRPVQGVEVIVNRLQVRAMTDSIGLFRLELTPSDSTIGFRRIGYRPLLLTIHPLPPASDTFLVELVSSPVSLPEVIVSAPPTKPLRYAGTTKYDDVFLRRRVGLGTLITREDIDNRFGFATHELLRGTPGVRIWNGPPSAFGSPGVKCRAE